MRQYIGGSDKANEIRMLLNHPAYKDKVIMIVEGGTDIRLFRKFLSHEMLKFVDVDGKSQVLQVMSDLLQVYPEQLLAICDADFDHVKQVNYHELSIYLTDYHDAEIMMIKSTAFNTFAQEFSTDIGLLKSGAILENSLSVAYVIGLLRWMSMENNLKLNFKGLNLSLYMSINSEKVELDSDALIRGLLLRSPNTPKVTNIEILLEQLEVYKTKNYCELQVCCGHDVTKIISCIYKQVSVSHETNMNQRKVESSLRIGYVKNEFENSQLSRTVYSQLNSLGLNLNPQI
jgi:hypothetical protein